MYIETKGCKDLVLFHFFCKNQSFVCLKAGIRQKMQKLNFLFKINNLKNVWNIL